MGIKMIPLVPTCQLHELCKKKVMKFWLQVSAVALHQLPPAAITCIVGGSIVNQSLGCFCLTHTNVTKDITETGTNFALIYVYSGYIQNECDTSLSLFVQCTHAWFEIMIMWYGSWRHDYLNVTNKYFYNNGNTAMFVWDLVQNHVPKILAVAVAPSPISLLKFHLVVALSLITQTHPVPSCPGVYS